MDERMVKAFDFSQDAAKQLITLATGVLAITITFFEQFAPEAGHTARVLMAVAWLLYLLSVFFGVSHLFMLTGALAPKQDPDAELKLHHKNADFCIGAQQVTFVAALVLTVLAGILAL